MATSKFVDRARQLSREIGGGKLTGRIVFDQPYAAKQHEELSFRHPHGGGAKYLTMALYHNYNEAYADLGRYLFDMDIRTHMAVVTESIQENAGQRAPVEFNDLRRSGSVRVTDGQSVVYDRDAKKARLSVAQMRRKDALRRGGYVL